MSQQLVHVLPLACSDSSSIVPSDRSVWTVVEREVAIVVFGNRNLR
jgi:hypothetical protein